MDLRIAQVSRFYSTPISDVFELDSHTFERMWSCIGPLMAQELLAQLAVESYPHIERGKQEKFHRELVDSAYPKEKKTVSLADALRGLNG